MSENYERVQMLLEPEQRRALAGIAAREGRSVADVTRQVIRLGLKILDQEDEFSRQEIALQRARETRQQMPLLMVDIVADLHQIREERDDQLYSGG